ncbi:MAG: hypothetical protein VB085_04275 [Peptococcaceae bacterium]|nr:hypothetical protein [Peptococcaceae bacterium]
MFFNTTKYLSGSISYSEATADITIMETGRYIVNWWMATQSSSAAGAAFAISSSQGDLLEGNSPTKTGEVYGGGIIDVPDVPFTLSLINVGTGMMYLSGQVPLQGALVVTQDNASGETGPTGPTGPQGETGPTGPQGETGEAGTMADTAGCFAIRQLANLLGQIALLYPSTTTTLFVDQLATLSGVAIGVYTAPGGNAPGLLIIQSGSDYGYVSLSRIAAIYLGDGSVYDPSITYLTPPEPYSPGCDTDYILAVQSSMSVGDQLSFGAATNTTGSGEVYINEPGIMVLSDGLGNTPVFIFTPQIRYMVKDSLPSSKASAETEKGKKVTKVTIQNS